MCRVFGIPRKKIQGRCWEFQEWIKKSAHFRVCDTWSQLRPTPWPLPCLGSLPHSLKADPFQTLDGLDIVHGRFGQAVFLCRLWWSLLRDSSPYSCRPFLCPPTFSWKFLHTLWQGGGLPQGHSLYNSNRSQKYLPLEIIIILIQLLWTPKNDTPKQTQRRQSGLWSYTTICKRNQQFQ